ncbi:methyltransferase domain-containing protein [Noviherbaspirillum saxi]|uniref:Methyltransferase domain-containing protein n=1 Tax=Noviherbaspirillum saxi TaxID=2320863 RepID=A0A3A3FQD6_9BURK|nr:methyltransferase domain-containing protein [Noviherbaspirillum saxi]RJF97680.1 methyltransferase domain-containing protein [Noviherbaspirillum saxi]
MAQDFNSRDPQTPEFWSERFEKDFTPWDRAGVPEALRAFVAASPQPLNTLIPGCGSGYEVACLADAGWDVTAIDFSAAAVAAAHRALPQHASRILQADFFRYSPSRPLDLIYERAFLCALPRDRWPAIAQRWAELLRPGALLAGFFFFDEKPKGPPFGASAGELEALLSPHFERINDQAVSDSVEVFAGRERWQIWQRKAG